ncbi:MAG: hypothetical protein LBQ54_04115 [Planctomycetaceae bacterium]|jgi:hypothetical protein|nr:hypothetical protein [Planctomycetaceae bacterium]
MKRFLFRSKKVLGNDAPFQGMRLVMIFIFMLFVLICWNSHSVCLAQDTQDDGTLEDKMDDLLQKALELDAALANSEEPEEESPEEEEGEVVEEESAQVDTPAKKINIPKEKDGAASTSRELEDFLGSDTAEPPKKSIGEKVNPHPKNVLPPDAETPVIGLQKIDPASVGTAYSPQMIKLLYDEITNGLNARGMTNRYYMFRDYARMTLNNTNRLVTGSEVDGRCRLSWYDKIYRNPIESIFEVEEFSRYLHAGMIGNHVSLAQTLTAIREKLDVAPRTDDGMRFAFTQTPKEAFQEVIRCITTAQSEYARALAPLSPSEIATLSGQLYNVFCAKETHGHTLGNPRMGRDLLFILEKMNRSGIHNAIEALTPLTDEHLLEQLAKMPPQRLVTSAGDILIGGAGNDTYDLDSPQMMNVVAVIDIGGNDIYREGTCSVQRPVLLIIDLSGNDQYIATKPGVQGGAVLGISMLIDAAGDDVYQAQDVAQGSAIGGAGILIDKAGNDKYHALRRAQGQALSGVGILKDEKGTDDYRAALWAQGFGNPGGFGLLEDAAGNDHYYLGGLWLDSYEEHPGYDGWGQGLGAGLRGVANGGIGVLLEGGGDDVYEFDYIAHGGGYWLGVGFLRDFGGNDKHIASTLLDYYGKPRREARWQRFSNGFAVHYALGYMFEDDGNDVYEGTIMGSGMAWDLSIGYLCDFGGNDQYRATGGLTQGIGAQGSIGILFDYFGSDTYLGGRGVNQGSASQSIDYHNPSQCGGNFSFLIDYGGTDQYGCGARNNSYNQRGPATGFLIDRPLETEPQIPSPQQPAAPPRQPQPPVRQPQPRQQPQPQVRQPQPQPRPAPPRPTPRSR